MYDTTFPFDTIPAPSYRLGRGRLLIACGILLMIAGFLGPALVAALVDNEFDVFDDEFSLAYLLIIVPTLLCLYLGVWLISQGRRMCALPALAVLAEGKRPPVLYLRSFDDDDLIDPTPPMVPLGDLFERRYEESLAHALEPIGPMICIGRPGAKLPQLGGYRLFVPDHAWQTAVEFLRERSTAIVLVVGRTEGLWWEIYTAIQGHALERLLFFFPYVEEQHRRRSVWQRFFHVNPSRMSLTKKAYQRMESERQARYQLFRERVQPLIPGPMPEVLGASQFMDFTVDGMPRCLPTVRPWWWPLFLLTPSGARMIANLKRTLQPFVNKLDQCK